MTWRGLGVDLSQSGLGLVVASSDWDLQWERIEATTLRARDLDYVPRLQDLAERVAFFARSRRVDVAWIEGYPTGGRVFGLDKLCELGAMVKDRLAKVGIPAETSPLSSARKLIMGKLPREDQKAAVHVEIRSYTSRFQTGDEIDAFVALNYGFEQMGGCVIYTPEPEAKPKATRSGRRKAAR